MNYPQSELTGVGVVVAFHYSRKRPATGFVYRGYSVKDCARIALKLQADGVAAYVFPANALGRRKGRQPFLYYNELEYDFKFWSRITNERIV